jgi:hypothetical protein
MTATFTNEFLSSTFGFDSFDSWVDRHHEWVYISAVEEAGNDATDEAIQEVCDRLWDRLNAAYETAVGKVLDEVEAQYGIEFYSVEGSFDREYSVVVSRPQETAQGLVDLINGCGPFYFEGVEEWVASGPYESTTDAILKHLHWISEHGSVYGTSSLKEVWRASIERSSRRW